MDVAFWPHIIGSSPDHIHKTVALPLTVVQWHRYMCCRCQSRCRLPPGHDDLSEREYFQCHDQCWVTTLQLSPTDALDSATTNLFAAGVCVGSNMWQ